MSRNVEVILMFWKAACGLNFLQDKFDENISAITFMWCISFYSTSVYKQTCNKTDF